MKHAHYTPVSTTATVNHQQILANDWGTLTKYDMTQVRSDGTQQRFTREA